MSSLRSIILSGVVAVIFAAVVLGACTSTMPTPAPVDDRSTNPAYVACMRDNGVDLPAPASSIVAGPSTTTPTSPAPPVDRTSSAFIAANATCKVLLPDDGAEPVAPQSTAISVPA